MGKHASRKNKVVEPLLLIKLLVRKMMSRSMILWLPEKVDSDGRQLAMCLSSSLMTCKS